MDAETKISKLVETILRRWFPRRLLMTGSATAWPWERRYAETVARRWLRRFGRGPKIKAL